MRILLADSLPESVRTALEGDGHDVDVRADLGRDDLPDALGAVDVLVVRSTRVTAEALAAADALQAVVRAGAGVNTIDTAAAAERGVYVCNVPGENAIAVAELTIGLLLALDRSIPDNVAELRAGRWDKRRFSRARGVHGRTLGILGLGDIGLEVAERARALGMRVVALDKPRGPDRDRRIASLGIDLIADRDDLLGQVDVLTLHVPAAASTERLVDADLLGRLPRGAWLINTSRGSVVDEDALLAALEERDLRAALDVYRGEPGSSTGEFDHPLAQHPRVYGTHHIGASTDQAQQAVAAAVVALIRDFERGTVRNAVNLETRALGSTTLTVRHLDRVGVLSDVLRVLREADLNVEQMANRVFTGATAAVATLQVAGRLDDGVVEAIGALHHVLHAGATITASDGEPPA